jgi:uncharacterized RDD family membrane protein YckC
MIEPATARYAGVVSRGIAFGIDAFIVVMATAVAVAVVSVVASALNPNPRGLADVIVLALAVAPPVLLVLYDATLCALTGRTPGKALLGLRVVRTDGRPVSLPSALVRALLLVIVTVGTLWSIVDRRHQGLHDKVAGTVVIYDGP